MCVHLSYDPNGLASGYSGVQNLARASISSLAPSSASGAASLAFYNVPNGRFGGFPPPAGFDKPSAAVLTCSLDIFSMVVVLGALVMFGQLKARIEEADDAVADTIGEYSLCVRGLPLEDIEEAEVAEHFTRLLDVPQQAYQGVAAVTLGREFGSYLKRREARAAAREEAEELQARLEATGKGAKAAEKAWKRLDEIEKRLGTQTIASMKVVCAFVTFDTREGRLAVKRIYDAGGRGLFQKKRLRFRARFALTISPAPEPTNVIWEHLEHSQLSRTLRRAFTALCSLCLILITTGFVVGATRCPSSPTLACRGRKSSSIH